MGLDVQERKQEVSKVAAFLEMAENPKHRMCCTHFREYSSMSAVDAFVRVVTKHEFTRDIVLGVRSLI